MGDVAALGFACHESKQNWRGNASALIQFRASPSEPFKNILVDCGKTFRQSVQRFFGPVRRPIRFARVLSAIHVCAQLGITGIDALVLTHEHADAVLGMDDLRDVQQYTHTVDPVTLVETTQVTGSLPTFLSQYTLSRIKCVYPYLISEDPILPPGASAAAVPRLDVIALYLWLVRLYPNLSAAGMWPSLSATYLMTNPSLRRYGQNIFH